MSEKVEVKKWAHRELIDDLAKDMNWWKSIILTETAAGSRWFQDAPIPDLMAIDKSYTATNVRIYEIKVTQSDFRNDVISQKWTSYLPYCDRFYFAIPNYLKWRELLQSIPEAGVMVRGDKGWKVVRKCHKKEPRKEQNEMFWMSLMFQLTKQVAKFLEERTELEKSQEYLKSLKKVRKNVMSWELLVNKEIERKRDELENRERSIQNQEHNMKRAFVRSLSKSLDEGGWHDNIEQLLTNMIWNRMQDEGRKGVVKLVDYITKAKKEIL